MTEGSLLRIGRLAVWAERVPDHWQRWMVGGYVRRGYFMLHLGPWWCGAHWMP